MSAVVLAVVSDTHVISTVGLCPDRVDLDDGGQYLPSREQRWLRRNFLDFCRQVQGTAEQEKAAEIVVVINGDWVDGEMTKIAQIATRNRATIQRAGYDALAPLLELSTKRYVFRGTPAHVGPSAEMEEVLARDIEAIPDPFIPSRFARWNSTLEIYGTTFDIAHHGKLGRTAWTRPNVLNSVAASVILNHHQLGTKPPNYIIRAHLHQYADTHENFRSVRVVAMPAWQLATDFVHTRALVGLSDIGGLILVCRDDGSSIMRPVLYTAPKRLPEKVL